MGLAQPNLEHDMKVIAFAEYGAPDVLQMIDRPVPVPSPGELLVRVTACGVNPADGKWRQGMFATMRPLNLPHVPGYDVAGIVEVGTDEMPVGTRVFAMLDNLKAGAYADYIVVTADTAARIPARLEDVIAAALPTATFTGLQLIDENVCPDGGDIVLITGALGAVGRFAVHAAIVRGVQVVAGVRANQVEEALAIGAHAVQVLGAPVVDDLLFDHVADTIGGDNVAALCRHARPDARIVTVATTPIPLIGLSVSPQFIAVHPDADMLDRIALLVASRQIIFPVARILPFSQAAEAHRLVEAGGSGGKIVL